MTSRRTRLTVLFTVLIMSGIVLGPVAWTGLQKFAEGVRARQAWVARHRFLDEHPPEFPIAQTFPEPLINAAAARAVHGYRLDPEVDARCRDTTTQGCFEGHQIAARIALSQREWGRLFLTLVMRFATGPRSAMPFRPTFGVRFQGGSDTTDVLIDPRDSLGYTQLEFHWRPDTGRHRHARAHMYRLFEGERNSDSTLVHIRLPQFTL